MAAGCVSRWRRNPTGRCGDAPYPGFATDLQAPLSVLMTQADGVSTIHETIYEDRLDYTTELVKMGAVIEVWTSGMPASPDRPRCTAARSEIADLRAGCDAHPGRARGRRDRVISGVEHVDRGYEAIESKLVALGAQITRIDA